MMYVGVDGCKAGWFAVILTEEGDWDIDVFSDVSHLLNKIDDSSLILIDIPIGLRERGAQERHCDTEARRLLRPNRSSSVFRAPCRAAIYCENYKEASDINEERTGRWLSLQTWNILRKIREVDDLLINREFAKSRVRETHPEICFWAMAGHPMEHSKKPAAGYLERMQVLQSVYPNTKDIINRALSAYKRKEVARDDILDALSAAVTAAVGVQRLVSIPEKPEFDSRGLRMEIVHRPLSVL
jgi:predicted RNase H-like nuclease